jgi:arylsulfatase A
MFFVDDLGYGDLGFTGHPTTHTPALDRLASTGKRLTQWYSAYPVCTSSRTALMTGRQPARVGMPGVINSLSAAGLPLSEVTLANDLSSLGCKQRLPLLVPLRFDF